MPATLFDLNIQEFLETWKAQDAVRELLANALDEALLSQTHTPTVTCLGPNAWEIRDFGRGLRPEHLTQAEDKDKHTTALPVIGRFGVGLKDALATLFRLDIQVEILSRHARYTLVSHGKAGFQSLETLHAAVDAGGAWQESGTRIRLHGLPDSEMEAARSLFLHFSPRAVMERGPFGEILSHPAGEPAPIYIRGLRVAWEENFLFSYNITSLTKAMRDALNRERTHVGRTAYADRIKVLLLNAQAPVVADALARDIEAASAGCEHDEVRNWSDVGVHACKLLNEGGGVVFVDKNQLESELSTIDQARRDGLRLVVVPTSLLSRLRGAHDRSGQLVRTLDVAAQEWSQSFRFDFVDPSSLSPDEQAVWAKRDAILATIGGRPKVVKEILISNTMRPEMGHAYEVVGLWIPRDGHIIIKRTILRRLAGFAGTLAHEVAHARSRRPDVDRGFECELSDLLGTAIAVHLT